MTFEDITGYSDKDLFNFAYEFGDVLVTRDCTLTWDYKIENNILRYRRDGDMELPFNFKNFKKYVDNHSIVLEDNKGATLELVYAI